MPTVVGLPVLILTVKGCRSGRSWPLTIRRTSLITAPPPSSCGESSVNFTIRKLGNTWVDCSCPRRLNWVWSES